MRLVLLDDKNKSPRRVPRKAKNEKLKVFSLSVGERLSPLNSSRTGGFCG